MRECEEKLISVHSAGPHDWLAAGKSPKETHV